MLLRLLSYEVMIIINPSERSDTGRARTLEVAGNCYSVTYGIHLITQNLFSKFLLYF